MSTYIPSPTISIAAEPGGPGPRRDRTTGRVREVRVALFSCDGIEALGHSVGMPLAVAAAVPDPDGHLRRLRDLGYASGVPRDHDAWPVPFDFDDWPFREWRRLPMDARWFGRRPHALAGCVEDGSLVVRLPPGVGAAAFSAAFRDGLAPLRFETVARRPSQCRRRHHARRAVAVASRYARASAEDPSPVEVRDLIGFSPRMLARVADVASATLSRMAAAGVPA